MQLLHNFWFNPYCSEKFRNKLCFRKLCSWVESWVSDQWQDDLQFSLPVCQSCSASSNEILLAHQEESVWQEFWPSYSIIWFWRPVPVWIERRSTTINNPVQRHRMEVSCDQFLFVIISTTETSFCITSDQS